MECWNVKLCLSKEQFETAVIFIKYSGKNITARLLNEEPFRWADK